MIREIRVYSNGRARLLPSFLLVEDEIRLSGSFALPN
jgi:hypothetical protein